jgi:hypothetical protein
VTDLSKQTEQTPLAIHWTTRKGVIALVVFLAIASLIEYGLVLYFLSLGLQDTSLVSTNWPVTLAISPLLNLVPICVIITLGFSWAYLTKRTAIRRQEIRKGKVETFQKTGKKGLMWKISHAGSDYSRRMKLRLSKTKVAAYISRVYFARVTVKSAFAVLLIFGAVTLMFLILAYPQLIYSGVSNAYRNNLGLFNFVSGVNNWARGVAEALPPIGWINNALIGAAPAVRDAGTGLGNLLVPLVTLDNAGKYLILQNAAAWISVLAVLFYGERRGRGYRYKK